MVQFLLKFSLKPDFFAVHHDFHWFWQRNFILLMLRSRKFWKGRVGYFISDSATLLTWMRELKAMFLSGI